MQSPLELATHGKAAPRASMQQREALVVGGERYLHITPLVGRYEPISLDEMDVVSLMSRVDAKYVMGMRQLWAILASLGDGYRVLDLEGTRVSRYRTLYFDTESLDLYASHHAGKAERYKVRSRQYLDSGASFLEVKHRTNKGRTIKMRVPTERLVTRLTPEAKQFVDDMAMWNGGALHPMLWNEFSRITLVSRRRPERVTFDLDLRFRSGDRTCALDRVVIAEVKQDRLDRNSELVARMRDLGIHRTAFSKYCIGTVLLRPEVKHNRFKPMLGVAQRVMRGGCDG